MKKLLIIILSMAVVITGALFFYFYKDTKDPYLQKCDFTVPDEEIPKFTEANVVFYHHFNEDEDQPVMGSALIDYNNDGVDELFIGGGYGQPDAFFEYRNGSFVNISSQVNLNKRNKTNTLGAVSFDLDDDGLTDLILTRRDGVFFLKNNGSFFESIKLDIKTDEKSNPATVTIGDYDKDGDADIFLCTYIKKELMEGQTLFNKKGYGSNSILLRNDGNLKFTNVTDELNLSYTHNTFQAVFVDIDEDGWLDLVVAYDTGEVRTYKNNNGKKFQVMPNPTTGKYGYPMGIGVGDYNNDGKIDFFFSNTGSTLPDYIAKGDLRKDQELITDWILFKNEGDFKFSNTSDKARVANFEFAWGGLFEDFNLDGRQDLVVAENYIGFPGHRFFKLPCRFLIQREDQTFAAVEFQAGVINKNYAITPLTTDFNGDGYPDLIYVNLSGSPRVFINNGGTNNYLKVAFPENAYYAGTKVELITGTGKTLSDHYIIGEGLASDMTRTLTFGLNTNETIKSLTFHYINGKKEIINNPALNKIYSPNNKSGIPNPAVIIPDAVNKSLKK